MRVCPLPFSPTHPTANPYDRVAKVVAPKKAALATAEAEYGQLMVRWLSNGLGGWPCVVGGFGAGIQ